MTAHIMHFSRFKTIAFKNVCFLDEKKELLYIIYTATFFGA
jgi:hypothetical protein